jgi:catechol 2,3-dioxygenase-like lactoylglutathione lyase family enzyme
MGEITRLNQIAFSVVDLKRTEHWFRTAFGLLPAGGTRSFRGPLASHVQGLPRAASTCWWLVGRDDYVQIELFQFESPMAKLLPSDYRPCDVGYSRVGIWVDNFDATLDRLATLDTRPLTAPLGEKGRRRVCVRSPDGVFIEVMEEDLLAGRTRVARPGCAAAPRFITVSVPDLEKSKQFFMGALRLQPSGVALHGPEHEKLWGLAGAKSNSIVLDGGDVLVELVQYLDPVGKPWPPGYRVSDQGLLNIAFGYRRMRDLLADYERTRAAGARPNGMPLHFLNWGVVYVNDVQGFSVELLSVRPRWDGPMGFRQQPIEKRPHPDTHAVERTVRVNAGADAVWAVLSDHRSMRQWFPLDSVTLDREGIPAPNGLGAERVMRGPKTNLREQVIGWEAPRLLRYRLLAGAPITCHQGEVSLRPVPGGSELTWKIRYRPKILGTSGIVRRALGKLLDDALPRLKTLAERG